jgi:cytochrome c biogenesis protein CcmG, thiol:disulfide interchange protein DsbE
MKKALLVSAFIIYFINLSAQRLPDFKLVSVTGDTITSELLRGKNVYINIWETYCAPCINEIPVLNKLKEKYTSTIFLAITPATKSKTLKFIKKYSFSFPVLYNAKDLVTKLIKGGYPTHVFVDSSGNLTSFSGGLSITSNEKLSKQELTKRIEEANYKRLDDALSKQ